MDLIAGLDQALLLLPFSIDKPGFGSPAIATVASAKTATATILSLFLSDMTASLWRMVDCVTLSQGHRNLSANTR